jgi:hypothetical protein
MAAAPDGAMHKYYYRIAKQMPCRGMRRPSRFATKPGMLPFFNSFAVSLPSGGLGPVPADAANLL